MTQPSPTLLGLVERFSPTGREAKATAWLAKHMRGLGFESSRVDEAGNAVGILGPGPRQIVLLGHIDTVPGEIPVRQEAGILHGRGSVDAKGSLAAFVDAAAKIGSIPGWQIVVIGAVDEEGDSAGARFISSRYQPHYAVIGEPSGWERLTLGYRGILRFRCTASRPIGHTAAEEESVCETVIGFWNGMADWCARENAGSQSNFDRISPSLQYMRSESDGFVNTAVVEGDFRLPLRLPPERVEPILQETAAGKCKAEGIGVPLAAFRADKQTPLVGAFLSAIRAHQGNPSFSLKLGTSDLCVVGPSWKCPMAVYGPGDSALDHTPAECLSLEEYEKAVSVLVTVLQRLTSPGR
jgi:LysW-gamma-L-lysine carboxypeptidase